MDSVDRDNPQILDCSSAIGQAMPVKPLKSSILTGEMERGDASKGKVHSTTKPGTARM